MRGWVKDHLAIDQFLTGNDKLMIVSPMVPSQIALIG